VLVTLTVLKDVAPSVTLQHRSH